MKKEPDDRNKLKIASFRTTDGDWFDFSQAAESNGLTATDVLKACMLEYLQGTYTPVINTPVSKRLQAAQGVTADEVQALISTAISTAPVNDDLRIEVSHLQELMKGLATHEYVEMALKPLVVAIDTQSQDLAAVRSDCDLTTEGIQRLITDALGKVSIATKKPHPTTIKTASIAEEPSKDVQAKIVLLEADPKLFARLKAGIKKGLNNAGLGQWLDDGGFRNTKGETYKIDSVSRFRRAFEYLENGGSIDG
jgi:hypothetical protein